jgi:hypothetical protein
MSLDAVADLVERYLNDAAFRTAFAADPNAAIADAGFELDASEIEALHSAVGATSNDQSLRPRVTRYSFGS